MKKQESQPRPRKVSRLKQCNKSNRLRRRYHTGGLTPAQSFNLFHATEND